MPSKKNRDYKREYKTYQGRPSQIRNRTKRNAARRTLEKEGRVRKGDDKDVDHRDSNPSNNKRSNLRVQSDNENRSFSRRKEKGHGKRYKK